MSSKIDERVVQMKFNSGEFAKGVAETSGALDRLKSALHIDGSNVNLSGLTSQVSAATSSFQGLQTVALGVLLAIGAQVVSLGQNIVTNLTNNLTSGARDGFKEYETQINAIATILGNVKSKGEDLASVNAALDVLNTYSDKTIYNFTEMVSGIKTLTNAGVGLNEGVQVVKGFANAAALAGVSSENMARGMEYGLNQAITKGYLGVQDFISIQDVVGEQFRNSLMETARVHGVNVDEIIARNGSFRDSLSEGWVTSQVMMETLSKFTGELSDEQLRSMGYTDDQIVKIQEMAKTAVEAATRVRTWTQLLDTVAEQVGSGWANTWRTVIGDSEQAASVFTMLSDEMGGFIQDSNDARNSQLELWASLGGRDALVEALSNAFKALHGVLDPIREAWAEVFPPSLGNTLAEISFFIRDFTKGLILNEEAQKNLKMVATAVFTVLKFGVDIIKGIGSVIGFLIGLAFDLAGAIFGLISPILTFVRSLMPVQEGAQEATSSVQGFFDMLIGAGKFLTGWIVTGLTTLGELFNNFLNSGGAVKRVKEFQEALKGAGEVIAMFWNIATKGDFTGNPLFEEDDAFIDRLFDIREGVITVIEAIQDFGKTLAEAGGRAKSFWSGIGGVIQKVWEFIKPVVDGIKEFFADVMAGLDLDTVLATVNTGVLIGLAFGIGKIVKGFAEAFSEVGNIKKSFIGALDELGGALKRFGQETKADQLIKIAGALIILAGALFILSIIDPERLIAAITAMATSFGILLGGLAILDKIEAEPSIKASVALSLIAVAVNIMATAVAKLGNLDPWALARGVGAIAIMLAVMIEAMASLALMGDKIMGAAASLVIMAIALNMLVIPIIALGAIPIMMLAQGMIALGIVLFGLVQATQALATIGPKMAIVAVGLIAMAVALNLLVIPITTLGLLPIAVLLQGMILLGIILFGLVTAAQSLSAIAPQMALAAVGMIAMAVALNLLVAPIAILGAMDLLTLVIGIGALAVMLTILVVATNAMTTAMPGAVAMIAVAGALLILSVAIAIMAAIGLEGIVIGILGLVIAVAAMAIISAILTPLIPVMFGVAGAMAVFGLAAILIAGSIMIAALAIGLLGPALALLAGGIVVFASVADAVMASIGPMMALGAALLVFGAGAIVAGAGALVLGLGLILLGAGLALVGAVGLIGATALAAVVKSITKLTGEIPGLLMMSGTFLALGAAVAVLGAGLLVLGAGALLTALGLLMLVPLGALVTLSLNMIMKAIERLAPMSGQISVIGSSLATLGDSTKKLATNGASAASGLNAMSSSFAGLSTGALVASMAVRAMAAVVPMSMALVIASLARAPLAFNQFAAAVVATMTLANAGLAAGGARMQVTAGGIGRTVGALLVMGIASSYGSVYNASVTLGTQMTSGMSRGLQNGSGQVNAMASQVARNALNAAKRTLGVASPSKEFTKVGVWSDEGLINGLRSKMGEVERAGSAVGNSALNAVRKSLSDAKNAVAMDMSMQPVIRPVLDLSEVKEGSGLIGGLLTPPSLKVTDSYAMASNLAVQERTNTEDRENNSGNGGGTSSITYNQYINSPKAISRAEVYRDSKNLISVTKGENPT